MHILHNVRMLLWLPCVKTVDKLLVKSFKMEWFVEACSRRRKTLFNLSRQAQINISSY